MKENRIPKTIHYCWFGGKPLPADVEKCIRTWKKICPDYEIKRWDESNVPIEEFPFAKAAYDAKAWAFVSDFVRLKVIYEHGGIYLDTDVEVVKSLDPMLKYSCFLARQQSGEVNTGLGFGAEKGNSVIQAMLSEYEKTTFEQEKMEELACPILNTNVLKEQGFTKTAEPELLNNVMVLSPEYMDPYSSGSQVANLFCDKTISIHHYSATWTSGSQRTKRKIARLIGEDKILWIKKKISKFR